jgi:hypothetical protein
MHDATRHSIRVWLASIVLIIPVVGACDGTSVFGVRGSGVVVSESREVSGFDEIVLQGSGIVRVEVTGTDSLTIEAEENLLDYLTSDVDNGRLELGSNRSISPTEQIVYTITASSLQALDVFGSGEITATGLTGDVLEVEVSGSGSIEVPDLEANSISADISGSGDVELSGTAGNLDLSISGSGRFRGDALVTQSADVEVSGSGDAIVNVTDELDASVSGSGNVEYLGDPSVNASTTGSGDVSRR